MRCDGQIVAGIREVEPTADGWANFERTGHITFACAHGLVVTGPSEQVKPLVELHRGLPLTAGASVQTVLGRA